MTKGRRPRGVTPRPMSGAVAESARLQRRWNGQEELPKSEVRGGGWEELPKTDASGSCQEELPHVRGQGWRPGGPTPRPTSGGCVGAEGPRGAIPR